MSYYIVVDDEPEFMVIEGPYRTQRAILESLAERGIMIFPTKRDARKYIKA